MLKVLRGWFDRYFAEEEAVLLALILLVGVLVVVTMGQVLAPMIASVIIAFLMQGMVTRLREWGAPHLLAVSVAFLVLVGCLAVSLLLLLPHISQQTVTFFTELPRMLTEGRELLALLPEKYPALFSDQKIDQLVDSAGQNIGTVSQSIVTFSLANLPVLASALIYLVLVPILVFFFLKDSVQILNWLAAFLPENRPVMNRIWTEMNQQIANYVRGKVIEILVVAVVSYACFMWLGLNYALLLAIAVGLSVLIPYIGAAVVTIPVALIGLFQWGWGSEFFYLLGAYAVIQALDGNVLVPLLFSEAVNLHPVAIILAVLAFGGLWGFWGVFFAIPLATLVKAVLYAWPTKQQLQQSSAPVVAAD